MSRVVDQKRLGGVVSGNTVQQLVYVVLRMPALAPEFEYCRNTICAAAPRTKKSSS